MTGSRAWTSMISHPVLNLEEKAFGHLGRFVGGRPWTVVTVASLCYLVMLPGVFLLKGDGLLGFIQMETDFMKLFTLTDSSEYIEYQHAQDLFADSRSVGLIQIPKIGESPLTVAMLRHALNVETHIAQDFQAEHDGRDYRYEELCARTAVGAPCKYMSAASVLLGGVATPRLQQLELMESNGTSLHHRAMWLVGPVPLQYKTLLPALVGVGDTTTFPGADANDEAIGRWLARAKTTLARFDLDEGDPTRAFERAAAKYIYEEADGANGMKISVITSTTLGDECLDIGLSAVPLLFVTIFIMICYVIINVGAETRLPNNTQIMLLLVGVTIPVLSSLAAFGFLGYVGIQANTIGTMAPFLGLAVGIDALFLMVTSINETGPDSEDHVAIMESAVKRGAVAATTTTLTSVSAFAVSAVTSANMPGLFSFNLSLVLVLSINWAGMITLFPACAVLNERRILAGRKDLSPCCMAKQPRQPSILGRIGVGRRARMVMASRAAPLVERSLGCQVMGAAVAVVLVAAGLAYLPGLGKGMPDRYLLIDSSPTQDYLNDLDVSFGPASPVEVGLLFEQPRLHDPEYRKALVSFTSYLSQRSDAMAAPDCWLQIVAQSLPEGAGEAEANAAVAGFFADPIVAAVYEADAHRTGNQVKDARCRFFMWQPSDGKERNQQGEQLAAYAQDAPLKVIAYHSTFPIHVARYREIQTMTISSAVYACFAVMVALLVTLPMHLAMMAVCSVVSVITVLFGFMSAAGITCNIISYVVCVMAIGFCVDYTCHVVHFADHGLPANTPWDLRMGHSLRECGFDVLQGCGTAFLGVAMLGAHGAQAFRIFSVMSVVITGIGGLFAMWSLPSVVALLARASRGCSDPEPVIVESESKNHAELGNGKHNLDQEDQGFDKVVAVTVQPRTEVPDAGLRDEEGAAIDPNADADPVDQSPVCEAVSEGTANI